MVRAITRASLLGSAVLSLLLSGPALADEPPPPLRCYATLHGLPSELREGRWHLRLPDGRAVPYDDGEAKDTEVRPRK